MSKKDDEMIRQYNANQAKDQNILKSLLGRQFEAGPKKGTVIDLSQLVSLIVTRSEFDRFKTLIAGGLDRIEKLTSGLRKKGKTWDETADVLGRLLAALERMEIITQDDLIKVSKAIEEGQRLALKMAEENKEKSFDEILALMKETEIDSLAVEEFEFRERTKAANRIIELHKELKLPKYEGKDEGEPEVKPKKFSEILEVLRAERFPEAQIREYIFNFMPWDEGKKGAVEGDALYCPECDLSFHEQDIDIASPLPCHKCGQKLFEATPFVRPVDANGKELEGSKTPEEETPKEETPEAEATEIPEPEVEEPEIEDIEDKTLLCPEDVESSEGHYDPSGPGANGPEGPTCAGCGTLKSEHKRVLKLITPDSDATDEIEKEIEEEEAE